MPRRCSGSSTSSSSATSWPPPRSSPATAPPSTCATSSSPIICFCSQGDDITPPQQALDWILDLYDSVEDIRANGQTIVYCVHDKIGHLGIFVSGGVAKKEHDEFASNIDFIDCLPPGLYEAVLQESKGMAREELAGGEWLAGFEARDMRDLPRMAAPARRTRSASPPHDVCRR